ncbi:DUF2793 domain-containing protein [Ascidiaceihabitans sp.]|uniref:DUF2793 domain-containing protein n=1 Tax=Ascidiaceihabitans sp. TaxID=1872644 RepID=UPI00329A0309
MSDTSLILGLPYIQPAQAQKHVTHNEALRVLDAVVQLNVLSATATTPPATPDEGDRYLVAATASGDWTGHDTELAVWDNGAWLYIAAQTGWVAFVRDTAGQVYFDGQGWEAATPDLTELQNMTRLGVGTVADATNPLAVSGTATLLNHAGSGHQLKVNKSAPADTASLLFQTDYTGHAEMGTAGNNDFAVKVSDDGNTWNTGAAFDAASGRASFPSGAQVTNRIDMGGRFYCYTNNRWVTHQTSYGVQGENSSTNGGTGVDPSISWSHMGVFLPQGAALKALDGFLRASSTEITGYDVQFHFQTGPFDTGWNANGSTVRTSVASQSGNTFLPGFNRLGLDLGGFVAPTDGFALLFIRPIGAITATRYMYGGLALSYVTAD